LSVMFSFFNHKMVLNFIWQGGASIITAGEA